MALPRLVALPASGLSTLPQRLAQSRVNAPAAYRGSSRHRNLSTPPADFDNFTGARDCGVSGSLLLSGDSLCVRPTILAMKSRLPAFQNIRRELGIRRAVGFRGERHGHLNLCHCPKVGDCTLAPRHPAANSQGPRSLRDHPERSWSLVAPDLLKSGICFFTHCPFRMRTSRSTWSEATASPAGRPTNTGADDQSGGIRLLHMSNNFITFL